MEEFSRSLYLAYGIQVKQNISLFLSSTEFTCLIETFASTSMGFKSLEHSGELWQVDALAPLYSTPFVDSCSPLSHLGFPAL